VVHTERAAGQPTVVALVGGGASGTLACSYLLREAAAAGLPRRIMFIDRYARHGLGRAYSTEHPGHLLNAPAEQMSALTDDPAEATGRQPAGSSMTGSCLVPFMDGTCVRCWPALSAPPAQGHE
jgi:FAD-NAD(P)-binding